VLAGHFPGDPVYPGVLLLEASAGTSALEILTGPLATEVSQSVGRSVVAVEAAGRIDAVSSAGATGLMQLLTSTAVRLGVSDSTRSADNIKGGVRYLDWLLGEFGGDPILALAGYNAGEGSVRTHAGVPPFAETRDYVPKVLAAFQVAKGLCRTPPQLASDGCVFVSMN